METTEISALLADFTAPACLSQQQVEQLGKYLEILLRWNARTNLTALRDEKSIVLRHFGESLFAARCLFDGDSADMVADLGSGAGFPGIPLKVYAPSVKLTLIESQNKKATFLKEVVRALSLKEVKVFNGRAEQLSERVDVVTLRAVERFERAVITAESLLKSESGSRLALLIGEAQVSRAKELLPALRWMDARPIPHSTSRVVLIGER